jgi:hypothetical protein
MECLPESACHIYSCFVRSSSRFMNLPFRMDESNPVWRRLVKMALLGDAQESRIARHFPSPSFPSALGAYRPIEPHHVLATRPYLDSPPRVALHNRLHCYVSSGLGRANFVSANATDFCARRGIRRMTAPLRFRRMGNTIFFTRSTANWGDCRVAQVPG